MNGKMNFFIKKLICVILFLFSASIYAANQDAYPFSSSSDATRFQSLTKEIRCVVCQNQNIADSNAPLATDLRDKVYQMVLAQQSDDEIKNYLVKRYGEFILLKPRFNKLTIALWAFPMIGFAFIFFFLCRFFQKQKENSISTCP